MKAAIASVLSAVLLTLPLSWADETVTRTETTTTTTVTADSPHFSLPPYQVAFDAPVQVSFHAPHAGRVALQVTNLRTGNVMTIPLQPSGTPGIWRGEIPATAFSRGDRLEMRYLPQDAFGNPIGGTSMAVSTLSYETLDTPESYRAQEVVAEPADLLIVPFQDKAVNSPAFNVYWPGLFYGQNPPYPLAARVTSSRAPENSVRKLDPVSDRPGWFQFQVPTLWFSPGERITVDFSTENAQRFNTDSDYPTDTNRDFVPVDTIEFQTISP